jgi:hypothetical protein
LAGPKPELPAEPETLSFIAASLRDLAAPQPALPRAAQPEPPRALDRQANAKLQPPRSPDRQAKLEPQASREPPSRHAEEPHAQELHAKQLHWGDAEDRPVEWRRPAILVGVPVAAVVLIGAMAGWQAGKGEDQPQSVTAALPPPKPRAATATASAAPAYSVAEAIRALPRGASAAARIRRGPAPAPGSPEDPLAARPEPSQVADTATDAGAEPAAAAETAAVETPGVETPAVETAAVEAGAAMPLPKAVIARTIHRIGYACGQVASTSAVEGARGVYNVTCTSGASYQAKPVRGRYHFRRVGGR